MTINLQFFPEGAVFLNTSLPQYKRTVGSLPISGLAFADGSIEYAVWKFRAWRYGSGNLTVSFDWYADTAVSGVVRWGAALAVITPNTDTVDVETKGAATANEVDDTHLGTTGQRLHRADVTVSNLDSLAADDMVWLVIYRNGSAAADTMAGDAILVHVNVNYAEP